MDLLADHIHGVLCFHSGASCERWAWVWIFAVCSGGLGSKAESVEPKDAGYVCVAGEHVWLTSLVHFLILGSLLGCAGTLITTIQPPCSYDSTRLSYNTWRRGLFNLYVSLSFSSLIIPNIIVPAEKMKTTAGRSFEQKYLLGYSK